jgi:PAS domain S-box-containing protein
MVEASPDFFRIVLEEHETPTVVYEPLRDDAGEIVDFTWVFANKAAVGVLPKPLEELKGRRMCEVMADDSVAGPLVPAAFREKRDVVLTGQPSENVHKFAHQGADLYVRLRNTPVGRYVVTTYSNVTSRVEKDAQLHEFAARLDVATRAAGIGVWERDVDTGRGWWDAQSCALHGLPFNEGDAPPEAVDATLHPDDMPAIRERLATLEKTGEFESRHRVIHPDGTIRWVQIFSRKVADADGRRLIGVCWDVTKEVEAAAEIEAKARELALAAERLAVATDVADVGVWEYDGANRNFIWNDEMFAILGVDRATFRGDVSEWRTRVHPDDAAACKDAIDRILREGGEFSLRHRIVRPSGEERIVRSYGRLVGERREGRIIGALMDITEHVKASEELARKTREAEAASEAKTRFLAAMSHEIRTPMNGVLGMSQALAMSGVTERQREMIDLIVRSGESLLAMLNDILDISRIEAGAMPIHAEAFHFGRLARDVGGLFAARAEAGGLQFSVEVEPEADRMVMGDELRVRQILNNLVANAVKFTEAGEVRVRASRAPDGALVLAVKDTGVGIAPDQQARIFEAFVQADDSSTRRFGGSGLGLSIVRRLAEAMGGGVSVESALGRGSTFTVRLALPEAAEAVPEAEPRASEPVHRRVLVAEDNATNRRVVEAILGAVGVELAFANDGAEAVAAWEAETFDVILMDSMMPRLTGMEAAAEIRAKERATGRTRTPIVAVTGDVLPRHLEAYKAAGMDAWVEKPIDPRKLIEAVRDAIQGREAERRRA